MKDLNAFITEISTIDYSYFWKDMEVITSTDPTVDSMNNFWQYVDNRTTATFSPFSESEIGLEYAIQFLDREYPVAPSNSLILYAVTELLTLPEEQIQRQINRLHKIDLFWNKDFEMGLRNSLFEEAVNSIEGDVLSSHISLIEAHGFINKNVPLGSDKIYIRQKFYHSFVQYIEYKLMAIDSVIAETGLKPDSWVTHNGPKFDPLLLAKIIGVSNNDVHTDFSLAAEESTSTLDHSALSLRQIALLYIYQGKSLSRSVADEIAKSYSHKSGEKLYKHYSKLILTPNRTGVEGRAIKPFIKDIKEVIPFLNDLQRQQAETEKMIISAKL